MVFSCRKVGGRAAECAAASDGVACWRMWLSFYPLLKSIFIYHILAAWVVGTRGGFNMAFPAARGCRLGNFCDVVVVVLGVAECCDGYCRSDSRKGSVGFACGVRRDFPPDCMEIVGVALLFKRGSV